MQKNASAELSNEELGKVAGGTTPVVVFSDASIIITTSIIAAIKDAIDN